MKIAFVGKGGSGKTTLAALFARHLAERGFPVLAIDADINQHLAEALGMSRPEARTMPALGKDIPTIKEYLRGNNPGIPDTRSMIKTTPPGNGSRLISITAQNPLFDAFSKKIGGVTFMATGPFGEDDIGIRCYHSKTGAVELMLNHLVDDTDEYAIVDMTAGADAFASGIFTRFDITFCIVEPTLKSIGVYEQYVSAARGYEVIVRAIGNKIDAQEDVSFIKEKVGAGLTAAFSSSQYIKRLEKGDFPALSELEPRHAGELKKMQAAVDMLKKDWLKFYRQAAEFHVKNARSWGNAAVGKDIAGQADPDSPYIPDVVSAKPVLK